MQTQFDHVHEVFGVGGGQRLNTSLAHTLKEHVHVVSSERRLKSAHFVQHAAHAPNVALVIIGLVLPDFGAGIVGRTSLSLEKATLGHLAHVEIAEFDHTILGQKDVRALNVPMHNLPVM